MVLCWDHQPKNRPSASQIVSIACAPEFTHLIDVVLLPHSDDLLAMCTLSNQKTQRDPVFKLWISIERCIEIIMGHEYGWLSYQRYQPSQMVPVKGNSIPRMTAMCCVNINTIWFGDSRGSIHSYKLVWAFVFFYLFAVILIQFRVFLFIFPKYFTSIEFLLITPIP